MSTAYKAVIAITGTLSTLVVLMLANYGRNAERRHLLRKGQRVEGTVVAIDIPGASTKYGPLLRYQFTPSGSIQVVEGCCRVSAFAPFKAGDTAIICYNKEHPISSIILSPKGHPL
jgi:hypothetical protein